MTPNVLAEVRRLMLTGLTPERAVLTVARERWLSLAVCEQLIDEVNGG